MLQSTTCIRMGEILLDENLQLFILCNNCHIDIRNFDSFRRHLETCDGVNNNLFRQEGHQLKYNTDKSTQIFGKTAKGIKEFLIYDYTDVEVLKTEEHFIDLINIEEELLDPKWYSDLNSEVNNTNLAQKSSKQYDVLVEEVTPFVHFKENVKSNNKDGSSREVPTAVGVESNLKKVVTNAINSDVINNKVKSLKRAPPPKTKGNIVLSNSIVSKQEKICVPLIKRRKVDNATNPVTKTLATPSDSTINTLFVKSHITKQVDQQPAREKETATSQILNKLTNLGLQIKRTNQSAPPQPRNNNDSTLENILLKLQSKGGMKVKLINKQSANPPQQVRGSNFNNLIIRKVN